MRWAWSGARISSGPPHCGHERFFAARLLAPVLLVGQAREPDLVERDLAADVERFGRGAGAVVEGRELAAGAGEVGVVQQAAGLHVERQLARGGHEARLAHLGHDERAGRPEVEGLAHPQVLELGRGRHRRQAHVVEAALRLGEPGPALAREGHEPLVPRALAVVELQAADQGERRRALVAAAHAQGQHRGRRDQLGHPPVGRDVRALARHRHPAVLADLQQGRAEGEDDGGAAGRAGGLVAAHGSPRGWIGDADAWWPRAPRRRRSDQGQSGRGRQQ